MRPHYYQKIVFFNLETGISIKITISSRDQRFPKHVPLNIKKKSSIGAVTRLIEGAPAFIIQQFGKPYIHRDNEDNVQ